MSTTLLKSLTTVEDIKRMMMTDYKGFTREQLDNCQHEITDSIMPIYYGDIIGEWQAMPSGYDGRGVDEFGLPPEKEITVYRLMELDLYLFYFERVGDAFNELVDAGYFDEEEKSLWQQVFPTIAEQARKARENA